MENNPGVNSRGDPLRSRLYPNLKINLAFEISIIVCAAEAAWATAQGRSLDVRGHGLPPAGGLSLARSAGSLWTMEFGLHTLAALVPEAAYGPGCCGWGAESQGQIEILGRQPYQGASGCEQSSGWPTKSSDRSIAQADDKPIGRENLRLGKRKDGMQERDLADVDVCSIAFAAAGGELVACRVKPGV